MRRIVGAVTATVLLAATAACGSTADDGAATSPTATPDRSALAQAWASVVEFNQAVADSDWPAAEALAVPDSPAAAYVDYRSQVEQAQQAAGAPPAPGGTVESDQAAGTVTVTIDGDDAPTYVWSGFETDDAGMVGSWETDQGALGDILVSPGSSGSAAGATVTLAHAYASSSGDLVVVVQVDAQEEAITVDQAVVVDAGQGEPVESDRVVGPSRVPAGGSAVVVYAVPGTQPSGTLVYEVQNDYDAPAPVELPLS
jgi:hypothetical protein